jgi:flagellar FliL protein
MNKKKILIILLVVLLGGGYVAKGYVMPKKVVKEKISGTIYILPKQFMVNLQDNRYATVTVALVLAPGQSAGAVAEGGATPPEGFGTLPEEAAVRAVITNILTDQTGNDMTSATGREHLKQQILAAIRSGTDVKVSDVLFTDLAVQ